MKYKVKEEATQYLVNKKGKPKASLKKMLAEQSREYLREIVRKAGIKKSEMLAEGKRVNKACP